ncbi:MAG: hypothetical protein ACERKK_07120 [Poseidonibacter sp.]|uniref:hypothetical protein n=1 Tax=Poseidonibacter sp. TaxID=2321188 RepID=UPI00359DC3CF
MFNYISKKNQNLMLKLNVLLEEKDKDDRLEKIEEEIITIQAKKYINIKQFE